MTSENHKDYYMNIETYRHKLPLLAVGQAQKEHTHNEALSLVDSLLNLSVLTIANDPSVADEILNENPNINGTSWLIGDQPSGIWQGHRNQIAIWSPNGWRYLMPIKGMQIYHEMLKCRIIFDDGQWILADSVEIPQGGSNIDQQARDSIQSIINILQQFGLSRQ